jgi:hypothetical protein
MNATIKSLLSKAWKSEVADLALGRNYIDEEFVVRVTGSVEKLDDELALPTVSIPLIPTLALFWEKCGIVRDRALAMLREALEEAMTEKVKEDKSIVSRIKDVDSAIKAIKQELIAELPKMHREGKVLIDGLWVEVTAMEEAVGREFDGELVAA